MFSKQLGYARIRHLPGVLVGKYADISTFLNISTLPVSRMSCNFFFAPPPCPPVPLSESRHDSLSSRYIFVVNQPYKACASNDFCMKLTPSELNALPTLTIHLDNGVMINVLPEAYMDPLGKDNAYAPR